MSGQQIEINSAITKEVVEQFEKVRQSGVTNMLDIKGVLGQAGKMDLWELWEFIVDDQQQERSFQNYPHFLKNARHYYEKFGVKHG